MWLMQVLRQLLAGLAHIHAQGIIHRVCSTPVSVCKDAKQLLHISWSLEWTPSAITCTCRISSQPTSSMTLGVTSSSATLASPNLHRRPKLRRMTALPHYHQASMSLTMLHHIVSHCMHAGCPHTSTHRWDLTRDVEPVCRNCYRAGLDLRGQNGYCGDILLHQSRSASSISHFHIAHFQTPFSQRPLARGRIS